MADLRPLDTFEYGFPPRVSWFCEPLALVFDWWDAWFKISGKKDFSQGATLEQLSVSEGGE